MGMIHRGIENVSGHGLETKDQTTRYQEPTTNGQVEELIRPQVAPPYPTFAWKSNVEPMEHELAKQVVYVRQVI